MDWMNTIQNAVNYIEEHITDNISSQDVSTHLYISNYYFQKGFSMLCGYSVSEYIRNRRLSLAGCELLTTNAKVIDIAVKYGYDSPDSFAKAFSRFHGISPSVVQKGEVQVKTFAPLKIKIYLEGGYLMNYKIEKKESFKVIGAIKRFSYQDCKKEIPEFWQEFFKSGNGKFISGMFGINIDETMGCEEFNYLIADIYDSNKEYPKEFVIETIPEFTWAVFSCDGPMPQSLQNVNNKIFSEWLPAIKEYEFAAGYCIEMYDDPNKYSNGTQDINYHSEIWIPVKKTI